MGVINHLNESGHDEVRWSADDVMITCFVVIAVCWSLLSATWLFG